jgi:hypothetical protein
LSFQHRTKAFSENSKLKTENSFPYFGVYSASMTSSSPPPLLVPPLAPAPAPAAAAPLVWL